jgi:hypothetical protein
MLLWDEIQGEPSRAMSAVNHQFRLAVAWRKHSRPPRTGKLAKSNAEQVARARQIVGRAALSDDDQSDGDQWPLCAKSAFSLTAWRTGEVKA